MSQSWSDGMQAHDLHRVAREAAELMERFSRASQQLGHDNRQACDRLQRTVQDMPGVLRSATEQSLQRLSQDTVQAVRHGLNAPMEQFGSRAAEAGNGLNTLIARMTQSQQRIDAATRKLGWMVGGTLGAMLLLTVGTASVLWHYKGEIDKHRIEAALLRAYNQADVNLCDGRLCARMDKPDKRFGGYRPVKPRPTSP